MSVTILDGGLGTTLEAELGPHISQSHLWSTQAVIDHPSALVKAHTAFVTAGARIIETATYQAALPSLIAAGSSQNAAQQTMLNAVQLALQAKAQESVAIALSLGPYGATLRPTQEFLGYYPPPYGPRAYSASGPNTRTFEDPEDEQVAMDALAQFHLDRLLVYNRDMVVWNGIDYLAFETVLLAKEVKAIRKAMKLFTDHLLQSGQDSRITWWITFVCPVASDNETIAEGNIGALVQAALSSESDSLPLPNGIGINCTSLEQLPSLIANLSKVVVDNQFPSNLSLVLYPNGGEYDADNHCWKPPTDGDSERWAIQFSDLLRNLVRGGQWKHIIAGGCCQTDATHIYKLNQTARSKRLVAHT